jgi:hypothetical protein
MLKYVGAYYNNLVVQHKVGRPSVFHLKNVTNGNPSARLFTRDN